MDGDVKRSIDIPMSVMESYRAILAGAALIEVLNEMVAEGQLLQEEAWALLGSFDESVQESIRQHLCLQPGLVFNKSTGEMTIFNRINNLWSVEADNVLLQVDKIQAKPKRLRILCKDEVG